jgi:carbonic anhydrase
MPKFAAGVVRFQNQVYPQKQALFESLAKGQSPEALFLTCSDSRIETGLLTQSEPGDMFICRNAGNIVPPHTVKTDGMNASIEYAVAVLKVPHIVVCGHTECGAMKGAMNPESISALPHVREWLNFSRAAVEVVKRIARDKSDAEKMRALLEQNVILQLTHLRTHPSVAAALAAGELRLHGWIYDIRTGNVTAYDEAKGSFVPVPERYAAEFARHEGLRAGCAH